MDKFSKLYIALKFRLKGAKMYRAMDALEMGREIHDGFRKDGVTPEFQHQIEIAHYIFTLKGLITKKMIENAIIVALLHDTDEDNPHDIPKGKLDTYGADCVTAILLLNKHRSADYPTYFKNIANNVLAALVKGADRINNFQSMNRGKFKLEKQIAYAKEVVDYFLPMLKRARKKFPRQMDAFYNIEFILKSQHELISLFISASTEKPA
jgi:(p)ppGpp synthase/HD superfamily hydrolase